MRFSQADLADLLDVSRATVSQATSEGYKCSGYSVRAWAEFDGSGRVAGYDVPSRVVKRLNPGDKAPNDGVSDDGLGEPAGDSLPDEIEPGLDEVNEKTGRETDEKAAVSPVEPISREMRSRLSRREYASLFPEGEDYSNTVSAGGGAYVVGKAIEEDNTTSRGAAMAAGAGVGGVVGLCAAGRDENVSATTGALVGSVFGALFTCIGMSATFDQPETVNGRQDRSYWGS